MERKNSRILILGISAISILLTATAFGSLSDNSYNPNPIPNFILSAMAIGDWQTIVTDSVAIEPRNDQTTELSLQTVVPIPPNERVLRVGFGWLYDDSTDDIMRGYSVMTHSSFLKDSIQNPYGWHVHNDLTFVPLEPQYVASAGYCVTEIGEATQAGPNFNQAGVSINVRNSEISTFMDPPTAISFVLITLPTYQCDSGIGLALIQVQPLPAVASAEEPKKGGNPNK